MSFGLNAEIVSSLCSVFSRYSEISSVVLYGSRAKGNYRSSSDIDLSIKSESLTHNQLLEIELELDDLLLPYKIDLSLYSQIDNPDLIDHIGRVGVKIFTNKI